MDGTYKLVTSLFVHDGPVRSLTIGPNGEIVTGCQSDSPNIRIWKIANNDLVEAGSGPIFHDHWVTALTSLPPSSTRGFLEQGCIISGCMDKKIRIFDSNGTLLRTMEGHSKGIISFSWTKAGQLISGSWDGTAMIWDLQGFLCVQTLGPHENGVQVMGLSNGLVATTSTGESVNGKPANFKLRFWDPSTGSMVGDPVMDHSGSIRSITPLQSSTEGEVTSFATTSNDGTVVLRSADGQPWDALFHPMQDDGSPPIVLNCCAVESPVGGIELVSCGEDGSVMVWTENSMNSTPNTTTGAVGGNTVGPLQSIPHPRTVWTLLGLPGKQGFLSAGHDGMIRWFSRNEELFSALDPAKVINLQEEFLAEVAAVKQSKNTGPTAEELKKAPFWDQRGQYPGKSEQEVRIFKKDAGSSVVLAAQWISGSWVIIGEVTGSGGNNSSDGGKIGDAAYDHIFPVEIEGPQGVVSLQLGYNDLENPFVAAQRFIDQNQLGQHYLGQIADWIVARSGTAAPTLGVAPNTTSMAASDPSVSMAPVSIKAFTEIMQYPFTFEDIPVPTKLMSKLREFNGSDGVNGGFLTEDDFNSLESLLRTLTNTSMYHSSQVSSTEFHVVLKMITQWDMKISFPALDILRVLAVHPAGSSCLASSPSLNNLLQRCVVLWKIPTLDANSPLPYASTLMLSRFFSNCFKHEQLRNAVINSILMFENTPMPGILLVLQGATVHSAHTNKLVRVGTSSLLANISLLSSPPPSRFSAVQLFQPAMLQTLIGGISTLLLSERESVDGLYRTLRALGTLLVNEKTSTVGQLCQSIQITRETIGRLRIVWGDVKLGEVLIKELEEIIILL